MAFPPELERELRQSVRQARMVAFVCCFLAPAMYLLTIGSQAYGSRWGLFLTGFGRLPWADPRVPWLLAGACMALALALVLPPRLGRPLDPGSALGALKLRNLVSAALLAGNAMCGLYLGIKIGPPAASLCLSLCLITMIRGCFVFPSEARWRAAMTRAR
jgi:hypothetical protein